GVTAKRKLEPPMNADQSRRSGRGSAPWSLPHGASSRCAAVHWAFYPGGNHPVIGGGSSDDRSSSTCIGGSRLSGFSRCRGFLDGLKGGDRVRALPWQRPVVPRSARGRTARYKWP